MPVELTPHWQTVLEIFSWEGITDNNSPTVHIPQC